MLIYMLVGNSLEIGCMTKTRFLGGDLEKIDKKITGYFREKVGFQFISGLFPGLIGVKWSQYATYLHLGPI